MTCDGMGYTSGQGPSGVADANAGRRRRKEEEEEETMRRPSGEVAAAAVTVVAADRPASGSALDMENGAAAAADSTKGATRRCRARRCGVRLNVPADDVGQRWCVGSIRRGGGGAGGGRVYLSARSFVLDGVMACNGGAGGGWDDGNDGDEDGGKALGAAAGGRAGAYG